MDDPDRKPFPAPAADGEGLGALTGATGALTPDDPDDEFVPAERREIEDPKAARVLTSAHTHHPEIVSPRLPDEPGQLGSRGADIAPNDRDGGYGSEHGLASDDPAYRMEPAAPPATADEPPPDTGRQTRIGGDEVREEEHF